MTEHDIRKRRPVYAPPAIQPSLLAKSAGLLEVILVIALSIVCALIAQQILPNMQDTLGLNTGAEPDFLRSAGVLAQQFALQYGGMLIAVLVFAVIRKRWSARSYALTFNDYPLSRLVVIGLVGGALAAMPSELIFILKEIYPLGQDTPIWQVIGEAQWDWRFWIFMAVGSFLLVPLFEELAWRGYALGRLVECFGPGAALLVTAVTFGLLHVQYLANGDALGIMTLISVIFSALVLGAITLRTGSVVPAIIAHMMINTPKSFTAGIAVIVIYLACIFVARRSILSTARQVIGDMICLDSAIAIALIIALIGIGIVASAAGSIGLTVFAIALAVGAIALAFVNRSAWIKLT